MLLRAHLLRVRPPSAAHRCPVCASYRSRPVPALCTPCAPVAADRGVPVHTQRAGFYDAVGAFINDGEEVQVELAFWAGLEKFASENFRLGDPDKYLHPRGHPHTYRPVLNGDCKHCCPPVHGTAVLFRKNEAGQVERMKMGGRDAALFDGGREHSRSTTASRRRHSSRKSAVDRGRSFASEKDAAESSGIFCWVPVSLQAIRDDDFLGHLDNDYLHLNEAPAAIPDSAPLPPPAHATAPVAAPVTALVAAPAPTTTTGVKVNWLELEPSLAKAPSAAFEVQARAVGGSTSPPASPAGGGVPATPARGHAASDGSTGSSYSV